MVIHAISTAKHTDLMKLHLSGDVAFMSFQDPMPNGARLIAMDIGSETSILAIKAVPGVTVIPRTTSIGSAIATILSALGIPATATLVDILKATHTVQPNHFFDPDLIL